MYSHSSITPGNKSSYSYIDVNNSVIKSLIHLDTDHNIDFSDYDSNNDNLVDGVLILHAGGYAGKWNGRQTNIMISPGGRSVMFLHRWFSGGRRYDRLFISDMKGKELRLAAEGIVSHCCWIDDEHILGYFTKERSLPGFHIIGLNTSECNISGIDQLSAFGDGHPDIHNDLMVFDTYPDKSRMKSLFVYDLKSKKINKVGEFLESMKYSGQTRCDLHPRWSQDGKTIFFDSVHEGKRKLYSINYHE
jgi:hypothetical protein